MVRSPWLQDLAENHRKLRHMMGVGDWDEETTFNWRTIRNNLCLLRTETVTKIYQLVVSEGHKLNADAATTSRADSFVGETQIQSPTEEVVSTAAEACGGDHRTCGNTRRTGRNRLGGCPCQNGGHSHVYWAYTPSGEHRLSARHPGRDGPQRT